MSNPVLIMGSYINDISQLFWSPPLFSRILLGRFHYCCHKIPNLCPEAVTSFVDVFLLTIFLKKIFFVLTYFSVFAFVTATTVQLQGLLQRFWIEFVVDLFCFFVDCRRWIHFNLPNFSSQDHSGFGWSADDPDVQGSDPSPGNQFRQILKRNFFLNRRKNFIYKLSIECARDCGLQYILYHYVYFFRFVLHQTLFKNLHRK